MLLRAVIHSALDWSPVRSTVANTDQTKIANDTETSRTVGSISSNNGFTESSLRDADSTTGSTPLLLLARTLGYVLSDVLFHLSSCEPTSMGDLFIVTQIGIWHAVRPNVCGSGVTAPRHLWWG